MVLATAQNRRSSAVSALYIDGILCQSNNSGRTVRTDQDTGTAESLHLYKK